MWWNFSIFWKKATLRLRVLSFASRRAGQTDKRILRAPLHFFTIQLPCPFFLPLPQHGKKAIATHSPGETRLVTLGISKKNSRRVASMLLLLETCAAFRTKFSSIYKGIDHCGKSVSVKAEEGEMTPL